MGNLTAAVRRPGGLAVGVGLLLAVLTGYPANRLAAQSLSPRDSARHALNRMAYGPRPGEVDAVARMGVMTWIERQLDPERIPDDSLRSRERGYDILRLDRRDLAQRYEEVRRERQRRQRELGDSAMMREPMAAEPALGRRLAAEFQELAVVRAVLSERQLREVMADFWTNHFNVFFGKGADRFLTPSYIEETIRPRALGKFRDLLIATAQSPAMLFYLDNARSVAPGSSPPFPRSALRRGGQGVRTGINENYARELLELHTLGVDGGYTQQDVVEVARILTGWSIAGPRRGGDFVFNEWAHDKGEKTVLGVRFPAGHGMDEGIRLLELLANHHATMHHVSRQLCRRFVADDPPDGCTDNAVEAWHRSGGDIREVLRAIVRSPDFWVPQNVRAKVKTPLEFVVSAVRATGAEPDSTPPLRLAQVVARLGQPLFLQPVPTGYPESQDDWVNSGALLMRMNVAVALAAGRLPGVILDLDRVLPVTTDYSRLIALVNERIAGGTMTEHTKDVIGRQLSAVSDPVQARGLAVGLALGGPEFQKQ